MALPSISPPPASALLPPGPDGQWLKNPAQGAPGAPFEFVQNLVRDFGDVVHYSTLYGPVYFFNHPEGIRQVLHHSNVVRPPLASLMLGQGLLASDGDYWRSQRRVMQPHFHEACLMGFIPLIGECIQRTFARWQVPERGEKEMDVAHEMKLLTLDIVCRAMFSADLSEHAEEVCASIGVMVEDLGFVSCTVLNSPLTISPSRNAHFNAARTVVDRVVYALIEERRHSEHKPRDLLTTLLEARDDNTGELLSDIQIRDEVVTILIAGHETTAITLAWALHLLAQHPGILKRLQQEADDVLGTRTATASDLPRLTYSEMVFNETTRLYPPVWIMVRKALHDDVIEGYPIPANAYVVVCPYTTHRHPDLWEGDVERFDPQRFAPDAPKRLLYTHFAFAGGRHLCLGMRFAIVESQIILAMLAQRFEFRSLPSPEVVPSPMITLRQKYGVPMVVSRRR